MKLKTFNRENTASIMRNGTPSVRVNGKSGCISFNRHAIHEIGITKDSKIQFVQDEDRPADWYIELTDEPGAFGMRDKGNVAKEFVVQNTTIARAILNSIGGGEIPESAGFLVATEPLEVDGRKLYAIITKSARK